MDELQVECGFCGKGSSQVKRLMSSVAVTSDEQVIKNCICDECLMFQLTVLAGWDSELFEKIVASARENAAPEPQR